MQTKRQHFSGATVSFELAPDLRPSLVAAAMPVHHPDTTDGEWDADAALEAAGDDADALAYMHAWVDPEGDAADPASYRFPHHDGTMDAPANVAAVEEAIAALADSDVPEDERAAVEEHMRAHLADSEGEEEPGEMEMAAIRSHSTCTLDEEWDGPGAVAAAPAEEATLRHMHAWVDAEADPDTKGAYKLPHHAPGTDTCANLAGVRNALSRLPQADIPESDRADVEAHLRSHLDDAEEGEDGASLQAGCTDCFGIELPEGEIPISGTVVLEGVETGDGRIIDEDALTWRDLPLPLMANIDEGGDHWSSMLVGRIETIEREGSGLRFTGFLADDDDARRVAAHRAVGNFRGISADLDSVESHVEWVDEGGNIVEEDEMPALLLLADGADDGEPKTRMRERTTKARLIGATLTPFPAFAEAEWRLDVDLGEEQSASTGEGEGDGLVAHANAYAGGPEHPPAAWFAAPDLTELTPISVTEDGHVFGHIALWESCHSGFPGQCIRPPRSESDYGYFTTGTVKTAEGERVPVGRIVMNLNPNARGHADENASAASAMAHYDNACNTVAHVVAGEDRFGIWVAGALVHDLSAADRARFEANGVSGDWRALGSGLELLVVHTVAAQGFPVPRARVADGRVLALVAGAGAMELEVERRARNAPAKQGVVASLEGRVARLERILREPLARKMLRDSIAASAAGDR